MSPAGVPNCPTLTGHWAAYGSCSLNLLNKAQALLDAHVRFILAQLEGEALRALIERNVAAILADARKLTLNEAVTRGKIKDVVRVYAIELDLHGAMPELVGDIARAVYADPVHDATALGDLLPDASFREMLDKAIEMKELRDRLLRESTSNPVYAALASDLLYHGIKGYLAHNAVTRSIPGARSMMKLGKSVMSKATPGLEQSIEENLKRYIRKNIKATLKESERFLRKNVDDEKIREGVTEVWDKVKQGKASLFRDYVSSRDVEDFFVIGYEYFRKLRKTEYFSAVINAGVDSFFDKYGDTNLRKLLDEVGISEDMLIAEGMRFAPQVIKALQKRKLLEPAIRRNLESFYASAEVAAILSG